MAWRGQFAPFKLERRKKVDSFDASTISIKTLCITATSIVDLIVTLSIMKFCITTTSIVHVPSLKFVGKAGAYPSESPFRCSTLG